MEPTEGRNRSPRIIGYGAAVVVTALFCYVVNNLLNWKVKWLDPSFFQVLWVFNISIGVNVVFNLVFMFTDNRWVKNLGQLSMNVASFFVVYNLRRVFPFILTPSGHKALNTILVILLVLVALSVLVEFVKLSTGLFRMERQDS